MRFKVAAATAAQLIAFAIDGALGLALAEPEQARVVELLGSVGEELLTIQQWGSIRSEASVLMRSMPNSASSGCAGKVPPGEDSDDLDRIGTVAENSLPRHTK